MPVTLDFNQTKLSTIAESALKQAAGMQALARDRATAEDEQATRGREAEVRAIWADPKIPLKEKFSRTQGISPKLAMDLMKSHADIAGTEAKTGKDNLEIANDLAKFSGGAFKGANNEETYLSGLSALHDKLRATYGDEVGDAMMEKVPKAYAEGGKEFVASTQRAAAAALAADQKPPTVLKYEGLPDKGGRDGPTGPQIKEENIANAARGLIALNTGLSEQDARMAATAIGTLVTEDLGQGQKKRIRIGAIEVARDSEGIHATLNGKPLVISASARQTTNRPEILDGWMAVQEKYGRAEVVKRLQKQGASKATAALLLKEMDERKAGGKQ